METPNLHITLNIMRRLLCLLAIFTFSCRTKTEGPQTDKDIKVVKRFNYLIIVDTWNGFSGHESKFILNNSNIDTYDSVDAKTPLAKPLTLYYISFRSKQN